MKKLLLTQSKFARAVGITPQTMHYLLGNGKLAYSTISGRKMIDYNTQAQVYMRMKKAADEEFVLPEIEELGEVDDLPINTSGKIRTIADARFELEKFKALKAKEEYAHYTGTLITLAEVEKAWVKLGMALKKSIMSLPARIGPLLAGENDPHATKVLLQRELVKCLQDTVDKYRPSPDSDVSALDDIGEDESSAADSVDFLEHSEGTPIKQNIPVVKKIIKKKIIKKKIIKKK